MRWYICDLVWEKNRSYLWKWWLKMKISIEISQWQWVWYQVWFNCGISVAATEIMQNIPLFYHTYHTGISDVIHLRSHVWSQNYSQTCPCGHLYLAVTFSFPVIECFIWIGPLLRDHLSYKATFSLSQRWPLNKGLTVFPLRIQFAVNLTQCLL